MGARRLGRQALAVAVVVIGTVTQSTSPGLAVPRASEPMTVERLLTRPIPKVCGFRAARYVDGVHPDAPGPDFSFASVVGAGDDQSRPLQAHVGELTGNGVDDGLMVVACTYGGNDVHFNVIVYRSDGRRLGRVPVERYVSTTFWAPAYPEASIRNGKIRIEVSTWRGNDAHCCPSVHMTLRFRWNGLKFVKL